MGVLCVVVGVLCVEVCEFVDRCVGAAVGLFSECSLCGLALGPS